MTNEERLAKIARLARDAAMSASPEPRYQRLLDDIEKLATIPPEPLTLTPPEPAPLQLWVVYSGTMSRIVRARDKAHAIALSSSGTRADPPDPDYWEGNIALTIGELTASGQPGIIMETSE